MDDLPAQLAVPVTWAKILAVRPSVFAMDFTLTRKGYSAGLCRLE
jgi:hypothetical protein